MERLAALDALDVLHTPPERAFDELARRASRLCGTPIALVSLVGDAEQWSKARVGIGTEATPRERAICTWCILEPHGVMVVPDLREDPRFRDDPQLCAEGGLRFYAGAPIVTAEGQAVGALCVMDRDVRTPTPAMVEGLRALAREATALLEARRGRRVRHTRQRRDTHDVEAHGADACTATARLDGRARVDAVTGLYDLRALGERLDGEIERSRRSRLPLSLLLLALDAAGAPARDAGAAEAALVRAARRIVQDLRAEDVVFRVDRDEIAVLLPFTEHHEAAVVAERLRGRIAADGVTASVGVAASGPLLRDINALLYAARTALTVATRGGRNRTVDFLVATPPGPTPRPPIPAASAP